MLVKLLSETEQFAGSADRDFAWPVWKQAAIVLWRFSNTHFGYRMAKDKFGCSHGIYNNFTDRFINVMSTSIMSKVITWPKTVERAREIADGFGNDTISGKKCLKGVIGAIDGKLIVIQNPSKADDGNRYADRKGDISMSLMAACDDQEKFISILTGVPGKSVKKLERRFS